MQTNVYEEWNFSVAGISNRRVIFVLQSVLHIVQPLVNTTNDRFVQFIDDEDAANSVITNDLRILLEEKLRIADALYLDLVRDTLKAFPFGYYQSALVYLVCLGVSELAALREAYSVRQGASELLE